MSQTTNRRPARANALQKQQEGIDQNIARIEAARRPSAVQILASRLNVPANVLSDSLRNTVFKGANDAEFVALVIVANEYGLNPLTKEMYAFPQKGGGIVPLVSVDGWIRIMNGHKEFDGIEFDDIADDEGKLLAIEAVIYRKDRTRAIKVTEYLDECKRNTEPWNKSPARMLRHRALIQCARIAFGFSGIYAEDDAEVGDIGPSSGAMPMRDITPHRQDEQGEPARTAIHHDPGTGEIDDDDGQRGPADSQRGESHTTVDAADTMIAEINRLELVADVDAFMRNADLTLIDEDQAARVEQAADARSTALRGGR